MSGSMQSPTACKTMPRAGLPGRSQEAAPRPLRDGRHDRLRLLAEAIEAEIVPRLVAGYDAPDCRQPKIVAPPPPQPQLAAPIGQDAVLLASAVLAEDVTTVRLRVAAATARMGLEAACLELLSPAARHLGDLWSEDVVSFSDVTIGLMRLQSALLHVTSAPQLQKAVRSPRHTALLAPAPGEQHTFGLTMVAGFLERAGWAVTLLQDGTAASIEAALRADWYGVLGLSAGSAVKLQNVPHMLPRFRAISRNPGLGIMVGGPVFVAEPGLATEIGADSTASDGLQAVAAAEALIKPRKASQAATG